MLRNENITETGLFRCLDSIKRDARLALRMSRRAPVYASMAILSLALGIGATTMIFTLMKNVVLDSLPVPHAEQLVILHDIGRHNGHTYSDGMKSSFSYPMYRDLNAATAPIFSGILAEKSIVVTLAGRQTAERVTGELVSGNFFDVLQVKPWRGRLLTPADDQKPGGNPVVVLGYGLWKRAFGADPNVVNRVIHLNDHPYVVIGVAPPNFYGTDLGDTGEIFVPMMMKAQMTPTWDGLMDRNDYWCSLVARMKNGIGIEQARAGLNVIYPPVRYHDMAMLNRLSAADQRVFGKNRIDLAPGGKGYSDIRETLRNPLRFLTVMVSILLLITIVNVANLMIARAMAREREMAVRLSVGAGRWVLVRQLLVESLAVALTGGALGIGLALIGTPALMRFLSSDLSATGAASPADWRVLTFTAVLTVFSGIAFGLLPAWQSARTDVAGALRSEGSMGHAGGRLLVRRVLVAGQIGFSLLLLTAAMLFTRSLQNLEHINPGFQTDRLVTFKVDPAEAGYSQERIKIFGPQVQKALTAIPRVESAAIATLPLLEDTDAGSNITVPGYRAPTHDDEEVRTNYVSAGFFATMQIPLLAGRAIDDSDSLPISKVAVVNETFAKHFFAGRNPLGARFGFGAGNIKIDWTIVGVVADSEHSTLRSKIVPFVYMPYLVDTKLSSLTFYVRARGDERGIMPGIRNVVKRYDASLPVFDLKTMNSIIHRSLFAERGLGLLSTGFAFLATLLAVVGLYGVMAYSVTRRRREFGIRIAIGARPESIIGMILREALLVGLVGIGCALPLVFATAGLVRSLLYGVQPTDPLLIGIAAAILLSVAVGAGLGPAMRAARIDPQAALRTE
ncbi:MAG TPA: ABC transporter permease [Bryobacteraceae bacterium]|nr:ABC transporter permease [Bryobacteraceae bacterium]